MDCSFKQKKINIKDISKSVKYTLTNDFKKESPEYDVVEFKMDRNIEYILFDLNPSREKIIEEISIIIRDKIKKSKHLDTFKIGDYDISVQHLGNERTIYANNKILSVTKLKTKSGYYQKMILPDWIKWDKVKGEYIVKKNNETIVRKV